MNKKFIIIATAVSLILFALTNITFAQSAEYDLRLSTYDDHFYRYKGDSPLVSSGLTTEFEKRWGMQICPHSTNSTIFDSYLAFTVSGELDEMSPSGSKSWDGEKTTVAWSENLDVLPYGHCGVNNHFAWRKTDVSWPSSTTINRKVEINGDIETVTIEVTSLEKVYVDILIGTRAELDKTSITPDPSATNEGNDIFFWNGPTRNTEQYGYDCSETCTFSFKLKLPSHIKEFYPEVDVGTWTWQTGKNFTSVSNIGGNMAELSYILSSSSLFNGVIDDNVRTDYIAEEIIKYQTEEKPDLTIEKIDYSLDNPTSPTKLHFRVTIKNIGTTSSSFSSNILIPQLSNHQDNRCTYLNSGESCVETGYGYSGLGGTISSGYYDIEAFVDPQNIVDELNENNNWFERRVYIPPVEEEVQIIYLNRPFTLRVGEKAELIDYKNMIVSLDGLDIVETCPVTATSETTTTYPCVARWLATVSMRIPGGMAIATRLGPGDIRDTPFNVKIRFDRFIDSNSGIFTIFQETKEFRFVVKTDRYWYSSGENVRIDAILVGDSSINLADARVIAHIIDPNNRRHEVEMRRVGVIAPTCTESVTTGTYTCARINEYHFVGVYNIPSYAPTGLYNVKSTATVAEITKHSETSFKVGEAYLKGVDILLRPETQVTSIGKEVIYKVTIVDKHPTQACPLETTEQSQIEIVTPITGGIVAQETEIISPCSIGIYNYVINVYGLPYHTVFPEMVSVPAGSSKTFEIKVFPSPIRTAQGIETAIRKTEISEVVPVEERAVSITGQQIATERMGEFELQPAAVNEALFKFTVKATLKEDPTVSDSVLGVLHVRFVQIPEPPPFPEEETIKIELKKGWNLVSLPGKGTRFMPGTCSAIQKPLAYVYLQDRKRYASLEEAVRIMGYEALLEHLSTHSFWVYSYEYCNIGFKVQSYSTYSALRIYEGWNLLGTTKDMVGETLNNIKGACTFEKVYTWDSDSQKWLEKTENDLIEKMGYGILVKASSSCNLQTNTIQPPALPEG